MKQLKTNEKINKHKKTPPRPHKVEEEGPI